MTATRITTAGLANIRKGDRGRRRLLIGLGFVVCFLVVNGIVGEHGAFALMQARAQYAELALTVDKARAENARLREEARRLLTDPAAIEEIARRELGLIKPGEKLFIIRDVPAAKKH
ncbi:MAG: septum formation initiator family protein [Acidobacteria bacterium]|nr:septum formation initiator family protein [Acidobacteriota bacterium]